MAATILVLEDDRALQELFCEVLEDEGYSVVAAETLTSLLDQMPAKADLLISDMLFDLKPLGLDAISTVRSLIDRSVPAILCTAAASHVERYQEQIDRLGAVVLAKPFTIEGLLHAVSDALAPKPVCA